MALLALSSQQDGLALLEWRLTQGSENAMLSNGT
jgi:hypothetical protein